MLEQLDQLRDESALAHTGRSIDSCEVGQVLPQSALVEGLEEGKLVIPPHDRGAHDRRSHGRFGWRAQLEDTHGFGASPQLDRTQLPELERGCRSHRSFGDHHGARRGMLLKTGGHVDGVAGHPAEFWLVGGGHDHVTRVDPDPHVHGDALAREYGLIQLRQTVEHPTGRRQGTVGVVFVSCRNTEDRHHRISHESVHDASHRLHLVAHPFVEGSHHLL